MKTAGEIYDMINSRSGKAFNKKEIAMMVAGVYAKQACEDLRERIAKEAKVEVISFAKGYVRYKKHDILNTKLILPRP